MRNFSISLAVGEGAINKQPAVIIKCLIYFENNNKRNGSNNLAKRKGKLSFYNRIFHFLWPARRKN